MLICQAFLLCAIVKLMVTGLPFRWTQKLLGLRTYSAETQVAPPVRENNLIFCSTYQIVDSISRHIFWTNTCLVRSIVVKLLLRRRHVATLLYLGLAKGEQGQLKAHAWLKDISSGLIYDDGSPTFTTVATLV